MLTTNTGYTSYLEPDGSRVIGYKRFVITTHELGHSWGSDHDPVSEECQPGAKMGGYYLMHMVATSGEYPNNVVRFMLHSVHFQRISTSLIIIRVNTR